MKDDIATSHGVCFPPRCARILKPGIYGSPWPLPSRYRKVQFAASSRLRRAELVLGQLEQQGHEPAEPLL